jgi:hypothetical protein
LAKITQRACCCWPLVTADVCDYGVGNAPVVVGSFKICSWVDYPDLCPWPKKVCNNAVCSDIPQPTTTSTSTTTTIHQCSDYGGTCVDSIDACNQRCTAAGYNYGDAGPDAIYSYGDCANNQYCCTCREKVSSCCCLVFCGLSCLQRGPEGCSFLETSCNMSYCG